ncbi:MAG TPA: 30S ribosomal protein S3 [Candidatus Paceibacterota bacterium]|nr:30S ribosomal protein S3 [Candidatus Paceibacterota bacterium]
MTHVAHPYVQRLGVIRDWKSRWITTDPKRYREYVRTDIAIRKFFEKRLRGMHVASVEIERNQKTYRIIISTSRPGLIIGRSGEGATKLRTEVDLILRTLKLTEKPEVKIDIEELRSPETSASVVGQMVVEGLEKRMPFRRVMKQTAEKVMANRDVKGVRIIASGRLGGAEMARKEELKKGRIPLQTLRADIDFARERALLPYGVIGIKVWIYRGDVFADRKGKQEEQGRPTPRRSTNRG